MSGGPDQRPAALRRGPQHKKHRQRWHPGIRLILVLLVAVPVATTALLTSSDANASWTAREDARQVATDATVLSQVASARAEFNSLEVPMTAVSYAAQIGVSEPELDTLLKPSVPFRVQLTEEAQKLESSPIFSATAALRGDLRKVVALVPRIEARTVDFTTVHDLMTTMSDDVDDLWYRDYNRLQADVASWQPPGDFEVHAAALYQTYEAFLAGGHEVEGAIYVLEGTGPSTAKTEIIQAAGEFSTATAEFPGQLSGPAQGVWQQIQSNPTDRSFAATIQRGLDVALNNLPPPFLDNLTFAGDSMRPGLAYLGDLDHLVTAAAQDLSATATKQANQAGVDFNGRVLFLLVLFLGCVAAVGITARFLTRPLRTLSKTAREVQSGRFDVSPLHDSGPREVVDTTSAFNDMTRTLQAVESKAVALSAEDLSDPQILTPLPGRTGLALQATIDALANRIRERELHRQQLHEAATHDRLTGLYNRAAIFDYLTTDVSRRRFQGEIVAVLFVDLDGLKPLNDTFGHEVGDSAIVATARVLVEAVGPCDIVGRLGGDEFLIVLCHDHSYGGDQIVQRIHDTLSAQTICVDGITVPLTASVGVALTQCGPDTDPMRLVHQADHAMYEAKKAARRPREPAIAGAGTLDRS